jgi:hypothetical protein
MISQATSARVSAGFGSTSQRGTSPKPKLAPEIIIFIKEMAKHNQLWGAERIRRELLKLDMRGCKRTIQKYIRHVRITRPVLATWVICSQNRRLQNDLTRDKHPRKPTHNVRKNRKDARKFRS